MSHNFPSQQDSEFVASQDPFLETVGDKRDLDNRVFEFRFIKARQTQIGQ